MQRFAQLCWRRTQRSCGRENRTISATSSQLNLGLCNGAVPNLSRALNLIVPWTQHTVWLHQMWGNPSQDYICALLFCKCTATFNSSFVYDTPCFTPDHHPSPWSVKVQESAIRLKLQQWHGRIQRFCFAVTAGPLVPYVIRINAGQILTEIAPQTLLCRWLSASILSVFVRLDKQSSLCCTAGISWLCKKYLLTSRLHEHKATVM